MKSSYLLSLPILALTACATGQPFQPVKAYDNEAKIVVYRKAPVPLTSATVQVNGKDACSMSPSSYFVTTAKPNQPLTLTYDQPLDWRKSEVTFKPRAGKTYYISLEMNMASAVTSGFGIGWNAVATQDAFLIFKDGNPKDAASTREACK